MAALETRVRELEEGRVQFRQALNRLGDALAQSHDREAIVRAVLEASLLVLRGQVAVFYLVVAGSDRLRTWASVRSGAGGDGEYEEGTEVELGPGEGLAGAAAQGSEVLAWAASGAVSERDSEPPAGAPAPARAEPLGEGTTAMAAPVRPSGRPYGVLTVYGRSVPVPFGDDDVTTLHTLVRQVETAIENTYLYEEATHLSLTDGLTGLWNRRHFDLRLEEELQRAVRFGESFGVLLTDLDSFKAVNDTHGHRVGDAVLVELAARLTGTTREVDEVARFGLGDEFTLLLPRTGLAGSLRLAEKVRAAVASKPFEIEGVSLSLTASVGVVACPEHGASAKHLVDAADEALRRAKSRGGDRVLHAKVANPAT